MEILNKKISPEAKALVEISEGKLKLSAVLDTGGVDANVAIFPTGKMEDRGQHHD